MSLTPQENVTSATNTELCLAALDATGLALLVLDGENRVVHVNAALGALLARLEPELEARAPGCTAALEDGVLDAALLPADLAVGGAATELVLGETHLELRARALHGVDGSAQGQVVEWFDRTPQRIAEHQIDGMIYGAVRGHLDWRLQLEKFEDGYWRRLAGGINEMLDALVGPLNVAAGYVDSIARGEIPPPLTTPAKGDFEQLRVNLNGCIEAIARLIEDSERLSQAGLAGDLDTRADASRHAGAFRRIVDGINGTLDALVAPIRAAENCITGLAEGDLTRRMPPGFQGRFALLGEATNDSFEQLGATVSHIREAAVAMQAATTRIAGGNADLAVRTEEQARQLELIARGMDELSGSVGLTAGHSREADELARAASEEAGRGGE
ncbi:MAG: hypothetical protein RLW42_23280, partial [Gammaproteobacteria bacterium]